MREIVLDTETTGLNPRDGDRVVEIGALELINHVPSGTSYRQYVNPERDMPTGAFEVHGLSEEFLRGHPVFREICDEFLAFIADSPLIIHNADFDLGFLDMELSVAGRSAISRDRVINTLDMARRKFPGAPASLDALCRRFGIDNSNRTLHGALLDSELLAEVYLELIGGRQPGLVLANQGAGQGLDRGANQGQTRGPGRTGESPGSDALPQREPRAPRPHTPTEEERAAHAALVARLTAPLWDG
ncbi:MAG: DNA polymerase III subunit epsilon [Rhodospirillaceae bacterium]|nr:DNA polymerase III subunit epsilon [Rhodospirillaceae bacterium]MBT6118006.1 DNA polymerase III subunit epsilon [Rhodospirillaceae bacterium]